MKASWDHTGREPATRAEARLRVRTTATPLRRRIDLALLMLLVALVAMLTLTWGLGVVVTDRARVLDPEIVQPLADERLVNNIRDTLDSRAILDATFHKPERRLYLAQQGGSIHSYDPETRLWSSDQPFPDANLIASDLTMLRSGCGQDPATTHTSLCADPESIWAISRDGGLVRRKSGRWQVVVSDVAWIGRRNTLVEGDQITAVASSPDGRWLLLGSRGDGVGLYDNLNSAWAAQPTLITATDHPTATTAIAWHDDAFWIGGPQGLVQLVPNEQIPRFTPIPGRTGEILDLDVATDGLWVLERRGCAEAGFGCLWLGKVQDAQGQAETFVNERAIYDNLSLSDIIFAQQWQNRLVVAGRGGIFAYDPTSHAWSRLHGDEVEDVTVTLALPNGDGFYFAYPNGIGRIQGDSFKTWALPSEKVRRLAFGRDTDEVLALTEAGHLFAAGSGDQVISVYRSGSTALDPSRLTAAVDLGAKVLLVGPDGALLHDIVARTYTDIPPQQLPDWMRQEGARAYTSGDHTYFVSEQNTQLTIYPVAIQDLSNPSTYTDTIRLAKPETLNGPAQRVWSWPGQGLGLIAGDGSVYSVAPGNVIRHTGNPKTTLDSATFRDVTATNDALVVTTNTGLRFYSNTTRDWTPGPTVQSPIAELDTFQGRLLGRTDTGELQALSDPITSLIGGESSSQISDQLLTDARSSDGQMYLAGNGMVERYNPQARQIAERWKVALSGRLQIKAVINGQPLVFDGTQVALGSQILDAGAGPAVSVATSSDRIWTVRRGPANLYLKSYSLAGDAASCLFRAPWTPQPATRIDDARALPDGSLAVTTDAGLMFYVPGARSWYAAAPEIGAASGRLYLIGDQLALAEPGNAPGRFTLFPVSSLKFPDSCAVETVSLRGQTIDVRSVAFDEAQQRIAWIAADGSVHEQAAGKTQELLAAEGGPDIASLRRVYRHSNDLLFTTDTAIWRYTLATHSWSTIQPRFTERVDGPLEFNIEGATVGVRRQNGSWYIGQLPASGTVMNMDVLVSAPRTTLGAAASSFVDVTNEKSGDWRVLLNDRIKFYDPAQRAWVAETSFPTVDSQRTLARALDRLVAVDGGGTAWWVATTTSDRPESFWRFDRTRTDVQEAIAGDGEIWRLSNSGELLRCTPAATYTCATARGAAMRLDGSAVRRAYSWNRLILFEINGGLRAFSPETGVEVQISDAIQIQGSTTARSIGQRLLLYTSNKLYILQRNQDTVQARAYGVTSLVFDDTDTPWALFGTEWQRWNGTDWVAPTLSTGERATSAGVKVFVIEGQSPVGVDSAGRLYRWNGSFTADPLLLPASISSTTIDLLAVGSGGDWWLRSRSSITHVAKSSCASATATPASATPSPSSTVTPPALVTTATPSASGVPCLEVKGRATLPAAFGAPVQPQVLRFEQGGIVLVSPTGQQVQIDSAYVTTSSQTTAPTLKNSLADEWPSLRGNLRSLPDGTSAYDPITDLAIDANGAISATRPTSSEQLATGGVLQPTVEPELDAGWLRWDRASRQFLVASSSGMIGLPKEQFIINGQFLFEAVDAVLIEAPDRFHIANQYGIWSYNQRDPSLASATVSWQRVALSGPMQAIRGRFLTGGGDITPGSALQPAQAREAVTLDDALIEEQIQTARISVTLRRANQSVNAVTNTGFLWDRGRRGIGYDTGGLLVQTDAGIHPTSQLKSFDPGPVSPGTGRLTSEATRGVLIEDSGRWYSKNSSGWQLEASDPTRNRLLVDNGAWNWTLSQGNLAITLKNTAFGFTYGPSSSGYGFNFDHIRAASTYDDKLFVLSDAFLEIADTSAALAAFTASREQPQTADRFNTVQVADGTSLLFLYDGGRVARWDNASRQFGVISASADPAVEWRLINLPRLRMTWRVDQTIKEMRLDLPGGGDRWQAFQFANGRFPFDVVTSFASSPDRLYVGSAAGLQVYSGALDTALDQIDQLYDLSASRSAEASVTRVGRPLANPQQILAQADVCVVLSGGQTTPCSDPGSLDTRVRLQSGFWQWTADAANTLSGVYLGRDGATLPIRTKDGRFPHDRLRDVAVCESKAFSVWDDRWISTHADTTLALKPGITNTSHDRFDPQRLLCLIHDLRLVGAATPKGLYAQGADGSFIRFDGAGWVAVTEPDVVAALAERIARPPIIDRARLRLPTPVNGASLVFEQQDASGVWRSLAWETDRIAIDQWREVVTVGDRLWVATPAGLVSLRRGPDGAAMLEPDNLMIVREPTQQSGPCAITDMMPDGAAILVRCDARSDQVFQGTLDGTRDTGVFSPVAGADRFSEQTLVEPAPCSADFLRWRLTGRKDGDAGQVLAERVSSNSGEQQNCDANQVLAERASSNSSEPVELIGGRFNFDRVRSLALFSEDTIEIASDGGWFTVPRTNLAAGAWKRPRLTTVNPADIRAVGVTVVGVTNERFLCLSGANGAGGAPSMLISTQNVAQPGRCSDYLADDELWRYARDVVAGTVAITARDGSSTRSLTAGRFTDDVIIGLPLAIADGESHDYLLPTVGGLLRLDDTLAKQAIQSTFSQLPSGEMPSGLYLWDATNPAYLAGGALFSLSDDQPLVQLNSDLPPGARVQAIEDGPRELLMLRWTAGEERGWSLFDRTVGQAVIRNRLSLQLANLRRFQQSRAQWGEQLPFAEVAIEEDRVRLFWPQPSAPVELPYQTPVEIVSAINYGDRILLIGQHQLYEINLNAALSYAVNAK